MKSSGNSPGDTSDEQPGRRSTGRLGFVVAMVGVLAVGGVLAAWVVTRNGNDAPARPPNIVLITFCTLRADRIGCYGYLPADTPTFDALAGEGVVFEDHYAQASFSGGSFASILTGRYCFHHGVWDHPQTLPQENVTLAEMLSAGGYRSAAFVTHPFVAPEHDFDQGFEFYHHRRRHSKRQADQAVAWIAKHAGEPFFLWYEAKPTHYPCWAPKELMRPEALPVDLAISRHRNERRGPEGSLGRLMFEFESLDYTEHQFASMMALYDAAVSFCDRLTGMIVDQLRASGVLDNTVVIVVADHGDAHGEHGLYFNHASNLYQPTVRVPLIVRLPGGQRAGQRVGTVTRNIDLLPTLADLAGVAVPPGVDGASLLPVLDGKDRPRDAFAESGVFRPGRAGLANYRQYSPGPAGKWRMIRRGNYKLIHIPGQTGLRADDYELYDLAADPLEQFDLAGQSPDVVEPLAAALAEWFGNYSYTPVTPAAPDQDETDDLRALGYVD